MQCKKSILQFSAALIMTILVAFPSMARAYDDSVALHGLDNAKVYFSLDTTTIDAERFPMLLWGIVVTHDTLVAQGVTPDFIVGFSGSHVGWLTTNADPRVKGFIQQLAALGIRTEVCYAAMNVFGVSPETILPELEIVGNVWISQIAYQSKSKGYTRVDF